MNREHILFHLQEAHEELTSTIHDIKTDPDYDIGEYWVALQHLYHHLNTAWNGRDATKERSDNVTEQDFRTWSEYPTDLPPLGTL